MPQARTSHAMNKSDASWHPCLCSTLWESIQSFTTKYNIILNFLWASLVAQTIKTPPAMRETWVWSLGWEDPLEEVMETQVSPSLQVVSGESPWTEEPCGLQSMGSQRIRHNVLYLVEEVLLYSKGFFTMNKYWILSNAFLHQSICVLL